jgi:hypothetical protein
VLAIGVLTAILLTSCGGDSGPGNDDAKPVAYAPFAGTWRGTLAEATTGSFGETTLTLRQSGGTLSGTWTAWFNSGTVNGGTISGSVLGNAQTADFRLTSTGPGQCPLSVTVSLQTGEAQGTYASVNCPLLLAGSAHVLQDGTNGPTYVPVPLGTPTGVAATAGNGQVTIRWTKVPGASSHNVYWSTSPGVTPAGGTQVARVTHPATITGLASGTPYYFVVTAANMGGEGAPSAEVSATPYLAAPNPPSNIAAVGGIGQATVTWPAVPGATAYNLYWSAAAGEAFSAGSRLTGVSSPFTLSGLTNGTTYFIAVTSTNAAGESAPSLEARATPYATYAYNFDDGSLQGWIPSGSWAVVSSSAPAPAHSGSYSVSDSPYGSYANYSNTWLMSPPINLSGSDSPVLTFWHRFALETGYDFGWVEISTNAGASWTTLRRFNGFQTQSWSPVTISLQGHSAPSVLIRFRLSTDGSVTYDGWALDDIVISR